MLCAAPPFLLSLLDLPCSSESLQLLPVILWHLRHPRSSRLWNCLWKLEISCTFCVIQQLFYVDGGVYSITYIPFWACKMWLKKQYCRQGDWHPIIFCINTLPKLPGIHGMIEQCILRCFRELLGYSSRWGRASTAPSVPTWSGFLLRETLACRDHARHTSLQHRCYFLLW